MLRKFKTKEAVHSINLRVVNLLWFCKRDGLDIFGDTDDDGTEIVHHWSSFICWSLLFINFDPVIYHQGHQMLVLNGILHNAVKQISYMYMIKFKNPLKIQNLPVNFK